MIIRMDMCRASEGTVEREKKWVGDPEVESG
jgi:hypothetical protein